MFDHGLFLPAARAFCARSGGLAAALGAVLLCAACSDGSSGDPAGETSLDAILQALRRDLQGTLLQYAASTGWPVPVEAGRLFVSTDPNLDKIAGDYSNWAPAPLHDDQGFRWILLPVPAGDRYKFTNGTDWAADPWSRSVQYDDFGEISLVAPAGPHLDRHFHVAGTMLAARTIRVWVPAGPVGRVLYVHDGQNLFDPQAIWGGWQLQKTAPEGMLLVGVDNTPDRMDEYTHVPDVIDGPTTGGRGDAYADYLRETVRPLIRQHYGEPGPVGTMGSSLGGLISFHIADKNPEEYAFAASLSGTMGWGRIGAANETLIERYQSRGHRPLVLYLDSGGAGMCVDSDNDSIADDDPNATDNYCENAQLRDVLEAAGYMPDLDLFYVWETGAQHNEAAWAGRVWKPLEVFSSL